MAPLMDLGGRIAALRKIRHLRLSDLAKLARIGVSTLREIEAGSPTVSIGSYQQVLSALDCGHDMNRVADLSGVATLHDALPRRIRRKNIDGRLPAGTRDHKTEAQQAFLRSGHPARFGVWGGRRPVLVSAPELEEMP